MGWDGVELMGVFVDDFAVVGALIEYAPDGDGRSDGDSVADAFGDEFFVFFFDVVDVWQAELEFLEGLLNFECELLFLFDIIDETFLFDKFGGTVVPILKI